jgi:hypothetical protein
MDGTRLRIMDQNSKRYVEFVKLMSGYALSRYFLQLDSQACSPEEFCKAQELLRQNGISFYLTTEDDPQPQKLVINCDMNMVRANQVARMILFPVFGLELNTPIRIGCYGSYKGNKKTILGWDNHPQYKSYLEHNERESWKT